MRIRALIALFALGAMLIALVGCSGNSTPNEFTVSGTVTAGTTNLSGVPLTLVSSSGSIVASTSINNNGGFTFTNVPEGTFSVVLHRTVTINGTAVPFQQVLGTVVVHGNVSGLTFTSLSDAEIIAAFPTAPTTPALVVNAVDQNGVALNVTVSVDGTQVASGTSPQTITTGLTAGRHTITLVANGQTQTYILTFQNASINVISAVFPSRGTGVTVSGTVTAGIDNLSGAAMTLVNPTTGVTTNSTTVGANGAFSFSNVQPGTYAVVLSRNIVINGTSVPFQQVVGTITVGSTDLTGLSFIALSTAQAAVLFPTPPSTTQPTLVVNALDTNGTPLTATVTFDGTQVATGTSPLIITTGITAGTHTVGISANGQTQTFVLNFVNGSVTVINTLFTPVVGTFSVSGTVTDVNGTALKDIDVALFQNNVQVGQSATTDYSGNYTLMNVAPGTYTLVASQTTGYGVKLITVLGTPVVVTNANLTGVNVIFATQQELQNDSVPKPNGTTAVLAVFVRNAANQTIGATVTVDGQTVTSNTSPIVASLGQTLNTTVGITASNGGTFSIPNVPIVLNATTTIRVQTTI